MRILKNGIITTNNLIEANYYNDTKGSFYKTIGNNLISGNVEVYTDKNGTISRTDTHGSIDAATLKSLAGKTLIMTYETAAPGDRYSVESGQSSVWTKNRYGIHGATYIDGVVQYPFTQYLGYNNIAAKAIMTWVVPTGETYDNLGFALQDFDKPASTNDEIWFIKNLKIEIATVSPFVYKDGITNGDCIAFEEFIEI